MEAGGQPSTLNGSGRRSTASRAPGQEALGRKLQEIRNRLQTVAGLLEDQLDPHARPLVAEARRVLAEQSCRIAVIGQIKAGKSSFLSAFAQRPGLLPTDVNPWTAVVTKLHFRTDQPMPKHAAVFHLFSEDEWNWLADGGGRVRELTERLVPGFEPELLRAQLEVMRQRAQDRLGADLPDLLGQIHSYEKLTPDLLNSYVTAGNYLPSNQPADSRLHYSDITRSAELFFNEGPFAFPVTLIDTPGVNDPFLVRDEITRRSLENSDIYIFVISALQPLSQTDMSLLRILTGLHKERIIVFVNRIDQLRNPLEEAEQIKAAVEHRLENDFPTLQIPVVIGSAWWGGLGQIGARQDAAGLLASSAIDYLHANGLPDDVEISPDKALSDEQQDMLDKALIESSGIPATAKAVANLLNSGSAAVLIHQLNACFYELAKSSEMSAKMELQSISGLLETRRAQAENTGDRLRQERESLESLTGPILQIQESFKLIDSQLNQILQTGLNALRKDLFDIIQSFARAQANTMAGAIQRREHTGIWDVDLRPLRDTMETSYYTAFRGIEQQVMDIDRILYPQLRNIIEAILPDYGIEIGQEYAGRPEPIPAITSLNETLVLDLDLPWWKNWFMQRPNPAQRANDLIAIIEEDFFPIAEDMVNAIREQISARTQRTLQQAEAVSTGMLSTVQERRGNVITEYEAFQNNMHDQQFDNFEAEQSEAVKRCETRLEACKALAAQLQELQSICNEALGTKS